MRILNTELLASPRNWLIVLLMLLFGLALLGLVFHAPKSTAE